MKGVLIQDRRVTMVLPVKRPGFTDTMLLIFELLSEEGAFYNRLPLFLVLSELLLIKTLVPQN